MDNTRHVRVRITQDLQCVACKKQIPAGTGVFWVRTQAIIEQYPEPGIYHEECLEALPPTKSKGD